MEVRMPKSFIITRGWRYDDDFLLNFLLGNNKFLVGSQDNRGVHLQVLMAKLDISSHCFERNIETLLKMDPVRNYGSPHVRHCINVVEP